MTDVPVPYVVTATNPQGVRDTFARDAVSLETLRVALEADGFTEIEFIDDDISSRLRQARPAHLRPANAAAYRREALARAPGSRRAKWVSAVRNNRLLLFVLLAVGVFGAVRGLFVLCALAAAAIATWAVVVRRARGRSDAYSELVRAGARGDREAESALIDRLLAQPTLPEPARADVEFRRIKLQAVRGDLQGALAALERQREKQSPTPGMYENRVGSLYYAVGDMTGFLVASEQASVAAGRTATHCLDLAFSHARVGDIRRAEALMATLDRRNLSSLHAPIATAIDGLVARASSDEVSAAQRLGASVEAFSAFDDKAAVWPITGVLRGHHALSLARLGRRDDALATLKGWEDVVDTCLDAQTRESLHEALEAGDA